MREELEQKIMHNFPWFEARNIWTDEKLGFPTPCSHGDGWFDLIYRICEEIDGFYKVNKADINNLRILQIKEKYGGLRFYIGSYIDEEQNIIDFYEEKSYHVCELCGKEGKLRIKNGWYTTVCDECKDKLGYSEIKKKGEII